jgi:hypothetical protein
MALKKKIIVVTPRAVASYPHLVKPDLYQGKSKKPGDNNKPKFKIKLVFDGDTDMSEIDAKALEATRVEWGEKIKPAAVKRCYKDGTAWNEEREAEGKDKVESLEGKFFIDASTQYRPKVVDAKKRVINPALVRGGDVVKAILEMYPCEPSGKKTMGVRLLAVQLIEKNSSDGSGWADEFGEEEGGYENENGFSEETVTADTQSGGGGDDDFEGRRPAQRQSRRTSLDEDDEIPF